MRKPKRAATPGDGLRATTGAHPFLYHLLNLLLHAAVVILLCFVLQTLLESVPHASTVAFAAALLFAVHPIHSEAVTSIVVRSELLAAFFLFAAWLLQHRDKQIPVLLCLLSKESAVAFIPLVLAGDFARGKWKPLWRHLAITGVAAAYLAVFWKIEGGRFGDVTISFLDNPLASLPAALRILNALRIAWKYIDYSYNAIALYASWKHATFALAGAIILLALFFWTLWIRRSAWFLAVAIFFGSFAITANILLPTGTIMTERFTYLPSAVFCLLLALLGMPFAIRKPAVAWALLAVVVAALGTRTILRNRDWKEDFTLFSTGVRLSPGSARAHFNLPDEYNFLEINLASHLMQPGETEEAFRLLRDEINTWPGYALAWSNRSVIHYQRGNLAAAGTDAETALRLDPGNLQAQAVLSQLGASNGARVL